MVQQILRLAIHSVLIHAVQLVTGAVSLTYIASVRAALTTEILLIIEWLIWILCFYSCDVFKLEIEHNMAMDKIWQLTKPELLISYTVITRCGK